MLFLQSSEFARFALNIGGVDHPSQSDGQPQHTLCDQMFGRELEWRVPWRRKRAKALASNLTERH
jgi:hypothetical protein